jgi:hypothetical protein
MKELFGLLALVLVIAWLYHSSESEKPSDMAREQTPSAGIVIARVTEPTPSAGIVIARVSEPVGADQGRTTTLAEDDAAMSRERLRSWHEKTTRGYQRPADE